MLFEFGPWRPDQPDQKNTSVVADNVVHTPGGYRPFPAKADYSSNALDARCQGADAFLASDGNAYNYAGNDSKLYELTAGATTYADVSIAGGYSTAADGRWDFAVYGDRVMATNDVDPVQSYIMGTSSLFANLAGSPPVAKYIAVAKNFVFLANTATGPDYIQWSAQGDPADWPTPGSADAIAKLSDRRQLAGDGGDIVGMAVGLIGADLVILQERQLVRGVFVGGDLVWQFDVAEGARGCIAPGSIVQTGGVVYYLGPDGWYGYNGMTSFSIGAGKVDKYFFEDGTDALDPSYTTRISGIVDLDYRRSVLWAYPSVGGPNDGSLDKIMAYSWETGEWSLIRSAGNIEVMTRIRAPGYTLEQLDAFGDLDSLPYSLDSRFWTGGEQLVGCVNTSQTLQAFNGTNLAATLTTVERTPGNGYRTQVNAVRPLVEGSSVTLTVTPITRERPNDADSSGTAITMNDRGVCRMRSTGRYHKMQMDVAAGGTWEQAIGVDVPDDMVAARGHR